MGYKLELGAWSAVFAVPNALVDQYIKEADGDQLKVMLWLLRHNGRPYAAEDLAAALGITPQRVDTALGFWTKSGLICSVGIGWCVARIVLAGLLVILALILAFDGFKTLANQKKAK